MNILGCLVCWTEVVSISYKVSSKKAVWSDLEKSNCCGGKFRSADAGVLHNWLLGTQFLVAHSSYFHLTRPRKKELRKLHRLGGWMVHDTSNQTPNKVKYSQANRGTSLCNGGVQSCSWGSRYPAKCANQNLLCLINTTGQQIALLGNC